MYDTYQSIKILSSSQLSYAWTMLAAVYTPVGVVFSLIESLATNCRGISTMQEPDPSRKLVVNRISFISELPIRIDMNSIGLHLVHFGHLDFSIPALNAYLRRCCVNSRTFFAEIQSVTIWNTRSDVRASNLTVLVGSANLHRKLCRKQTLSFKVIQ